MLPLASSIGVEKREKKCYKRFYPSYVLVMYEKEENEDFEEEYSLHNKRNRVVSKLS